MVNKERNKPFEGKNYTSIPHLSGSKLNQQADKKISIEQEIRLTEKSKDSNDLVIIQEKIDGSNVGIYFDPVSRDLIPITRKGYTAESSVYKQHHLFAKWVYQNEDRFYKVLNPGERICGEWIIQAHGIKYKLFHEPFVAFDIMFGHDRCSYVEFLSQIGQTFITAALIHIGQPISVKKALKKLGKGRHGGEYSEGVVYRLENSGRVLYLAKHVVEGKVDGLYMQDEIFNEGFEGWVNE